jgi:hypothetical protein
MRDVIEDLVGHLLAPENSQIDLRRRQERIFAIILGHERGNWWKLNTLVVFMSRSVG